MTTIKNTTSRSAGAKITKAGSQSSTGTVSKTPTPTSPPTTPTKTTTTGFAPFSLGHIQFMNPATQTVIDIPVDITNSINNIYLQKTIIGPSTLSVQLTDPNRQLVKNLANGGVLQQGTMICVPENGTNYYFSLVQFVKASDQIQLSFESQVIYELRNQRGAIAQTVSTGVTEFIQKLATAISYNPPTQKHHYIPGDGKVKFVGADYATVWSKLVGNAKTPIVSVGLGRGTTADPNEDSYTAMSRIASGVGWRLWEDENTVYFGPDEYWLGLLTKNGQGQAVPPINKLKNVNAEIKQIQEFSDTVQLIDFDWDVGKPYAQATVTCMMDNWQFNLGEIVQINNLGIANGYWMVAGMQRDMYLPQASLTLQVPMPFASVYNPTSAPLPGFPLTTNKIV